MLSSGVCLFPRSVSLCLSVSVSLSVCLSVSLSLSLCLSHRDRDSHGDAPLTAWSQCHHLGGAAPGASPASSHPKPCLEGRENYDARPQNQSCPAARPRLPTCGQTGPCRARWGEAPPPCRDHDAQVTLCRSAHHSSVTVRNPVGTLGHSSEVVARGLGRRPPDTGTPLSRPPVGSKGRRVLVSRQERALVSVTCALRVSGAEERRRCLWTKRRHGPHLVPQPPCKVQGPSFQGR